MMKKILLLFTVLLLTAGGGQLWADTYTIAYSGMSSNLPPQSNGTNYDYTYTFPKGLTMTYTREAENKYLSSGNGDRIKYSHMCPFTVSVPTSQVITSVEFDGYCNSDGNTSTLTFNGSSTDKTFEYGTNTTHTFGNLSLVGGFSFRVNVECGLKITITTEDRTIDEIYDGTYPYTWDFTVETDKWAKSINTMQTSGSGNNWSVNTTDGNAHPTMVLNADIPLDDIDIIKGLRFVTSSDVSNLSLDWTNKYLHLNGYVTIPNVKVGQTITFVSSSNVVANEYGTGRVSGGTGKVFKVTTSGNVQFTVNANISSISVTKSDIGNFRLEGGQGYNHGTSTSTYIWPYGAETTKNFNFKVSNGTVNVDEVGALYTLSNTDGIVVNTTNFSISSDNSSVISATSFDQNTSDAAQRRLRWTNVTFGNPGEATVTFTFNGNDQYNSKEFNQTFTITKLEQVLAFAESSKTVNFVQNGTATPQTATKTVNQKFADDYRNNVTSTYGGTSITYSSSNTNVATVNASTGEITMKNSGKTIITATALANDIYESATASYTLTVTGSQNHVLTWDTGRYTSPEGGVTERYGNTYWNRATCSTGTVKYSIDDPSIATISVENDSQDSKQSLKIVPKSIGSTIVRAYVESSGDYNGAELTFTLTVNKGVLSFQFDPTSGTVKKGLKIAPRLIWPSDIKLSDILSISAVSNNTDVATIPSDLNTVDYETRQNNPDGTIIKRVFPVITASSSNTGAAKITVTFESNLYETVSAEYTLTVVENTGESLGSWTSNVREYTLYTDDFMKMPEVTSSGFSGNFNYSVGSINESSQNYLYDIKSGVKTFNNKDWKRGEGVPDFIIENNANSTTGEAYIFWIKGGSDDEAELFIYAKQAGDVILKARDSQTSEPLPDITIHIREKSEYSTHTTNKAKDGATGAKYVKVGDVDPSVVTTWTNGKKFPFTWDFTNIESISDLTNCYWIKKDDTTYSLGFPTTFNYDYADIDNNNNTFTNNEVWYKPIHLTEMEGMTIWIGNNATGSWKDKNDKVRIYTKSSNDPCLYMNGGNFKLTIPNNPSEGQPDHYKVFVKVAGNGGNKPRVIINVNGTNKLDDERDGTVMDTQVVSADVNSGEPVILTFNNVKVYWIAFSTEAKNIPRPTTNEVLTYAAASYSYNADLDISKSLDANDGVTAYYASGFTKADKGISAGSYNSDEDEGDYAVKMSRLNGAVPANTGILLKKASPDNCYMIVNAKNMESEQYSTPNELSTNYLKGTGSGVSVSRTTTIDYETYSNFAISHAYKYYKDITNPSTVQGGYRFDRDWSFYPIMGNANIAAQKAYLQIPGNLYVNKNGEIVDLPASSRASWRAADDDDAPVAPASKAALSIVFEDELPLSPENPDVTGVFDIERHADDNIINNGVWYNMEGMRISTPTKPGLYIRNGKKVFIK